jgi:hypothetical protein
MTAVSNLYAAKVYSEHPIAIWPLDDDASYISLISNVQRKFEPSSPYPGWSISGGTANDDLSLPNQRSPFDSNIYSGVEGDVPALDGDTLEARSPELFDFNECSETLKTFSISMYVYQDSIYVSEYEIGYEYYDNATSSTIEVFSIFPALEREGWIKIEDSFIIQEFDSDSCKVFFRAKLKTGGSSGDYDFILNGITVGQWSENFSSHSLGGVKEVAPVSSGLSGYVISGDQYGLLSDNAYYVIQDGQLLAKNTGIPMIFGSENITKIYPSSNGSPSLIFPNKNMLTKNGRYKNYTLEFWLRVRPSTKESRKILGTIDTNDGLYVKEGFLTLVVDKKFISHNISTWYRPMIVHIVIKNDAVSLLINGEQVGQIQINKDTVDFSESDWFGFYSYEDIDLMEIDCISIMPYSISNQVAKKRFVWGQGTDSVQTINNSFDGEEAVIDFSSSRYTSNKIYPDVERWDAGYYNNLVATRDSISVPDYQLPEIYLGGRDVQEWYKDNKDLNNLIYPSGGHSMFFSFRPNIVDGEWVSDSGTNWTEQGYLNFTNLSFLISPITTLYGIFEVEEEVASKRPLIQILNKTNGKKFEISLTGYNVKYEFDSQELPDTGFSVLNSNFVVGFNIQQISENFNYEISSFFGSPENLEVYVGGDGSTTFEGKIYRVGFSDQSNFNQISSYFHDNGIAKNLSEDLLEEHYASYTLSPFFRYESYFLDISVYSEWEEYFPLSYFASYVTKRDGSIFYDLDYLQLNFGYPSLISIIENEVDNPDWSYQQLFNNFNSPIQKSYEVLDNSLLSGYVNYLDLKNNIITEYLISTEDSSLDAYITFQLLAEGADEPLSSFIETKQLTDSYTVYAEKENTNQEPYKAYKTKFGVIDGVVIYPPKSINFKNVAMVVHFKIQQDGIVSQPLKIKNLEISSKSLNENGLTPIGTKTGKDIYPYVKTGIYYSGKSKNPVMINKDNLPYLYLTENSGIRLLSQDQDIEYGIAVPINNSESSYSLGAFQLFMKYDQFQVSPVSQVMFELLYEQGATEFVVVLDETSKRFKLYARDKVTKIELNDLVFYQNGLEVKNPYLIKDEWNSISVSFNTAIILDSYTGSLNIFSGATYNNLSFFRSTGLNEFSSIVTKNWSEVLYGQQDPTIGNIVDWQYWYDENGLLLEPNKWKDVYVLEEIKEYSTTPRDIYQSYVGTNISVIDDDLGMSLIDDDFYLFADQTWLGIINKPV